MREEPFAVPFIPPMLATRLEDPGAQFSSGGLLRVEVVQVQLARRRCAAWRMGCAGPTVSPTLPLSVAGRPRARRILLLRGGSRGGMLLRWETAAVVSEGTAASHGARRIAMRGPFSQAAASGGSKPRPLPNSLSARCAVYRARLPHRSRPTQVQVEQRTRGRSRLVLTTARRWWVSRIPAIDAGLRALE